MTEPLIVDDGGERVCPACFAPVELLEQGEDPKRGPFEVWGCTDRAKRGFDAFRHAEVGVKGGTIRLTRRDYERAARRRAAIARLKPNPKHAPYCVKFSGMPGRCSCSSPSSRALAKVLARQEREQEEAS